jgi:hypothetical protein
MNSIRSWVFVFAAGLALSLSACKKEGEAAKASGATAAPGAAAPATPGGAGAQCATTATKDSAACKKCCNDSGLQGYMWMPNKCRCS